MNATGRTIYHWAVEPEVLTVINYTLDTCPDRPGGSLGRIALWETRQLKLKDVYGYEPGKEVALIWWVLGRRLANGCFKPARISSLVLARVVLLKSGYRINITGFTD